MRFDLRPDVRRLFRLAPRSTQQLDADIDEELEALIANRVEHLVARGLTPDLARAEAVRRLGASVDDARHQLHQSAHQRERRMHLREQLETIFQDLRYAVRGLARRPAFTTVAVLTLAIGIGATTAIFSAVNVLLLRPLPYAQPDELMNVSLVTPDRPGRLSTDAMVWSYPKYRVFRDAQRAFSDIALYAGNQYTFSATDPERVRGEIVGARYFRVLGLTPIRGRDFEPAVDSVGGGVRQTILSYSLWNRRFNADPAIVGRTVTIDREPYLVIGIAPQFFNGLTGSADLFVPITTRDAASLSEPQSHEFWMVARRAPGVTDAQAIAAVQTIGARLSDQFPDAVTDSRWGATARPLNAERVAPAAKRSLLVLFGAVGFVLLIACVNVANLLLGRASARRREIAVRLAIGAARSRLVRLLLTESLVLALVGGVASVGVAWAGVRALNTINPATFRVTGNGGLGAMSLSQISLDWTTLGFTLGVAVVVGILFGVLPALHATRASLAGAIKDAPGGAGRRGGASMGGRRVLVVAEVALAIVLLAGSGLMLRSLTKLLSVDAGFDGHNMLTFRLNIPPGSIPRDSTPGFYAQMEQRLRAIPGASDVGLSNCAPFSGGCNGTLMRRLDRPEMTLMQGASVGIHWASATWFQTLHVPLVAGRLFNATDRVSSPRVVVINEAAAKAVWPGENPIGKHVELGQGGLKDAEVIGVVRGVRQRPDSAPVAEVYGSLAQVMRPGAIAFVRAQRDASSLTEEVRRAMHEIAPSIPIFDMQTMDARTVAATGQARFSATLLGLFALTALSLAAIGIYGVMSLAVSSRSRELGIRIALGADQGRVKRLVIREGVALAASGAVIGLVAAFMATRVLRTMLYDLAPSDPATYAVVVLLLGGTAVAAAWLPARRAARVDPVEALRAD